MFRIKQLPAITLLFWVMCLHPADLYALDIMLPQVYTKDIPVIGWLMSEKLDGIRGYWDGKQLFSKNGRLFHPPSQFTQGLPPFPLEGELWSGRGRFEKTVSTVMKQYPHDGWIKNNIRFAIFDVPKAPGSFMHRLEKAKFWFTNHPSSFAFVIPQTVIHENNQMQKALQRVERLGGEGLIVRNPNAFYTSGRSNDILKVKSFLDMEAVVIAHIPGKGRHLGRLGSLLVELISKNEAPIRFKIGTGLSDAMRDMPPPIGSIITFKYYGLYESGTPKFPSFLRTRRDKKLSI